MNHLTKQATAPECVKKTNYALLEPQTAQPKQEHLFGANFSSELTDKSTRLSL